MAERQIRCALLTLESRDPRGWPEVVLSGCPGLELVALSPPALGEPDRNPYGLPEDDRADVTIVPAWWYRWLTRRHPERADDVLRELERRAEVLVGLEGGTFALTFPPSALERFAITIKLGGIYRDRDLYNWVVGPRYPGANWTEKLRPRASRYRDADLDKLRLSVPCFTLNVPAVRRRSRAIKVAEGPSNPRGLKRPERLGRDLGEAVLARVIGLGNGHGRPHEVHCLTGLTHVQRIEAVGLLESFSGTRGITPHDHPSIMGTRFGDPAALPPGVRNELIASAQRYWREPVGRLRFLLGLRRHRIAVAPTGHGELSYRHGEALCAGAALVCQDLSHVEMMLPLEDRVNAAFCRPDLSDLRATVEELLRDDDLRNRIARVGRRSYVSWAAGWRSHIYNGIEAHIREAVGLGSRSPAPGPPATERG